MWELVWKDGQHCIFLNANTAPCVAYAELNELPSHVAWKLVSSLKKENLLHGGVALRTVPKQAARNLCPRGRHHQQSVGFSQCGGLPFEIKEREQIFDLEIKAIFRKNIYLAAEGIISTAGREIRSVCAL